MEFTFLISMHNLKNIRNRTNTYFIRHNILSIDTAPVSSFCVQLMSPFSIQNVSLVFKDSIYIQKQHYMTVCGLLMQKRDNVKVFSFYLCTYEYFSLLSMVKTQISAFVKFWILNYIYR